MTAAGSNSFRAAIVLGLMYALSVMDRQIVAMLLEPIKKDMQLSDTQLAMMSGLVFALFYGCMGIPIARLVDRANRVNILSWCLAVWSIMTSLSGMAINFVTLLLARIGVGVGEAGCQPAGQSLIADIYDEKRRGRALALFAAGAPVGALIAYVLGGVLADNYGWRMTLILAGVPGLVFAVAIRYAIREPARAHKSESAHSQSVKEQIVELLGNAAYRNALLGHICCIALSYTIMVWVPTLMVRSFDMSLSKIGLLIGGTAVLGGIFGSVVSGIFTDKLVSRDTRWLGRLPMIYCLVAIPAFLLCIWSGQVWGFLVALTLVLMLMNGHSPPCYATYHKVVAPESRGMSVALSTLSVNIIGLGLAPLMIGALSDNLAASGSENSLKMAMYAGVIYLPLGAYFFARVDALLKGEQIPEAEAAAASGH